MRSSIDRLMRPVRFNGSINDVLSIIFLIYSSRNAKKINLIIVAMSLIMFRLFFQKTLLNLFMRPTNRIKLLANMPVAAPFVHLFSMF